MEPIRVLQVVPMMRSAGIENFIMNTYRNIDRNIVQFDFLVHSTKRQEFDDEIEKLGGKIYRLTYKDDKNFFKYIKDLNSFFKNHKEYNIVHGEMQSMLPVYLKIARKHNVKVRIAHSHNANYEKSIKGFILHILSRKAYKYATDLWACSDKAGNYLFPNRKFEIIHNAIDHKKFVFDEKMRNEMRTKKNLEDKFVIGHIGRFELQKNHNFLIDIFYEIQKINPKAVLICIGAGELKDKIMEKTRTLKIDDKVIFEGVVNNSQDYYQMMDCFILPSLYEGLPLVGVEAQINGLPCYFSDTITKELDLSDKSHFISLDKGAHEWANIICNTKQEKRESQYFENYDLQKESIRIMNKYIDLLNKK